MIDKLVSVDTSVFIFLNSLNATWLNPVMVFLSGQLIWAPIIALLLFLSYRKLPRKQFYLFVFFLFLAIMASDVTSSYIFKNIFKRLRPCRIAEIKLLMNNFGQKCGGRFGFVSSHAANSFVLISFFLNSFNKTKFSYHLMWIIPFIVSYSRIYLGVHFPGDIAVGACIGIAWGYVFASLFKRNKLWSEST